MLYRPIVFLFFFFNDTATTEIYTLSLHDALPILFGAPPIDVVVGAEVHASIRKALSMAGFGRKRVTVVDADSQGRMRSDRLPPLTERTIVCIQDRKSTRLNSSHGYISYAVFCLKKKKRISSTISRKYDRYHT